ncbi:uracil-DNA glycosylase family protein [Paenibacillus rigui]|uniref:Uracil-DNA glycosylase-like domain-containing protein n=1 Tax=Paenibacillus rigui TaxID=554312 RepID=A0A229UPI7_9BACL|nr:uracil-DNA glycosylase family protein [Paenibacillus rigui]OXM85328.1 hypothetical protein CF651_17230 [Paenibacillus rigui]
MPPHLQNYINYILSLPPGPLTKKELLVPELLIEEQGDLGIYYAPMDYINNQAKLMIIGITPGFTQMEIGVRQARQDLLDGVSFADMEKRAKKSASFAGSMRSNLIAMLDELGLPEAIGLPSSEALFGEFRDRLHTTSVLRYPVFIKGENYTGHQPDMLKSPILSRYASEMAERELKETKDAFMIPLGKSVSDVLRSFVREGVLDADRCLFDFPHPSGANGHRKSQFEKNKEAFRHQLAQWGAGNQL